MRSEVGYGTQLVSCPVPAAFGDVGETFQLSSPVGGFQFADGCFCFSACQVVGQLSCPVCGVAADVAPHAEFYRMPEVCSSLECPGYQFTVPEFDYEVSGSVAVTDDGCGGDACSLCTAPVGGDWVADDG